MIELNQEELTLILAALGLTIKQIENGPDKDKLKDDLENLIKLYEKIRNMPMLMKQRVN